MKENIKIRMLSRFGGKIGKMEKGLIYNLDRDYANELVKNGLAEYVISESMITPITNVKVKGIGKKIIHVAVKEYNPEVKKKIK